MEQLVRVVHGLVVPVEHVIVDDAVGLGIEARGDGEMVDERLRGEHVAHVRRRGGRLAETGQVRCDVGPHVVRAKAVERRDHHQRVPRDRGGRDRDDRAQRGRTEHDRRHHDGGRSTATMGSRDVSGQW